MDLTDIKTWSTFDNCVSFNFSIIDNKLNCDVKIYDGDGRGDIKSLRFTASLILPNDFIKEIEKSILWKFDNLTEESYYEYLENQKKIWKEKFKSQILEKL